MLFFLDTTAVYWKITIYDFVCIAADEEPEKKELLGVNTGIVTKPAKLNPFVKIFSFFRKKCTLWALSSLRRSFCMY